MQSHTNSRAHVSVAGRVQGVYFRARTAEEAQRLGLSGWVRNTPQGVEAVFEGSRETVERAIAWCHQGPPHAVVDTVDIAWEDPEGLEGFSIRY
jgi:acylphosphatase